MSKVHEIAKEKIISLLDKGIAPWRSPYLVKNGAPRNFVSGKPYRGINTMMTWGDMLENEYPYGVYATPNQLKKMDLSFKGAKTTAVFFWKFFDEKGKDGKPRPPLFRYYRVINLCQIMDPETLKPSDDELRIEARESITRDEVTKNYLDCPKIVHSPAVGCYRPSEHVVGMPNITEVRSDEDYYSMLFHELTHSTKHSIPRSDSYAFEELTAEMGASFLCSEWGIEPDWENSAAYIQTWKDRIEAEGVTMVEKAAGKAQKAVDLIQGRIEIKKEDAA